jgi:hypothetical protein
LVVAPTVVSGVFWAVVVSVAVAELVFDEEQPAKKEAASNKVSNPMAIFDFFIKAFPFPYHSNETGGGFVGRRSTVG